MKTPKSQQAQAASRQSAEQEQRPIPKLVAAASCSPDISIILNCIGGLFEMVLMWGTNTPENADNPAEGAFIDSADGIALDELEARMFEEPSTLRQAQGWKLEVDVCDVFTDFIFTPSGRESLSLSVPMETLSSHGH